jgi:FkbM family methyltransferase
MLASLREKLTVVRRLGWFATIRHIPRWFALRLYALLGRFRGKVDIYGVTINLKSARTTVPWPNVLGLVSGAYEQSEMRLLREYLRADLPVIELGASIGVVACVTNKKLNEPHKHLVVEANPALIPFLEGNRSLNGCSFDIRLAGVGPDSADLYVAADARSASMYRKTHESVRVPCISFAKLIAELGWRDVFLICDIEGAEAHLILEEGHVLKEHVQCVLFEFHPQVLGSGVIADLNRQLENLCFSKIAVDGNVSFWKNRNLR